jgi:hypothetical protein
MVQCIIHRHPCLGRRVDPELLSPASFVRLLPPWRTLPWHTVQENDTAHLHTWQNLRLHGFAVSGALGFNESSTSSWTFCALTSRKLSRSKRKGDLEYAPRFKSWANIRQDVPQQVPGVYNQDTIKKYFDFARMVSMIAARRPRPVDVFSHLAVPVAMCWESESAEEHDDRSAD